MVILKGRRRVVASQLVPRVVRDRVTRVLSQIEPYAQAWANTNKTVMDTGGPSWVVLGDSLSQGIGASSWERGWVYRAVQMLGERGSGQVHQVLNLSISGATTHDVIISQLPALSALARAPEVVTIIVGANDMRRSRQRSHLAMNFATILDHLPAASVVAKMPQTLPVTLAVNRIIDAEVHGKGVQTVDLRRAVPFLRYRASDLFHPDDRGHERIAEAFAEAMSKMFVRQEFAVHESGH